MPNVQVLNLEANACCTSGILAAHLTFPSQLTELTLCFERYLYKQHKSFCYVISELSKTLTKYIVLGLLQSGLEALTQTRPEVDIFVEILGELRVSGSLGLPT